MSSAELFVRQTPKTVMALLDARGGEAVITNDVALALLARCRQRHPIGSDVMEAKVVDSLPAKKRIAKALLRHIGQNLSRFPKLEAAANKTMALYRALCAMAVHETTGTQICKTCKGRGEVLSRRYAKLFECKRCKGVGRISPTHGELLHALHEALMDDGVQLTDQQWQRIWYDAYMQLVDHLHQTEAEAKDELTRMLKQEFCEAATA